MPSRFKHIDVNGAIVCKVGAGVLRHVVVNRAGIGNSTLTLYDNTTATPPVIAVVDATAPSRGLEYNLTFSTGLTVVMANNVPADVTVVFD